jgi:hypothetical protein
MLLTKGLIRIGIDVPAGAEFDVVSVDDPHHCGTPLQTVSMYAARCRPRTCAS